jgi:hypothetical protein
LGSDSLNKIKQWGVASQLVTQAHGNDLAFAQMASSELCAQMSPRPNQTGSAAWLDLIDLSRRIGIAACAA